MIKLNHIKTQLTNIIDELNNCIRQNKPIQKSLDSIKQLKTSITSDYTSSAQEQQSRIMALYNNLCAVEASIYRYNQLLKANLTKEVQTEAQKINQITTNFISNFTNRPRTMQTTKNNTDKNVQEVLFVLQKHIKEIGTKQAVTDFQRGLNILNKYNKKSPIEAKRPIDEDGILGNQTYACLQNICQKYTPQIIKKYLRRGAINNAIFDTKNDKRINTDKKVLNIYNSLSKEKINV